jgi:hypothetical protein
MRLDLGAVLRNSRAQCFRARGLQYLCRRQRDLAIAARERNWALRGLLRLDWRDYQEALTHHRYLARRFLRLAIIGGPHVH